MNKLGSIATKRRTLGELREILYDENTLSERLFAQKSRDRWGLVEFEMVDYVWFLDHVASLLDLIEGLEQLSPFADDALDIAISMTEMDFISFKLALAIERRVAESGEGESKMPKLYHNLLLPNLFVEAFPLSEKARVSLGLAIFRMIEAQVVRE